MTDIVEKRPPLPDLTVRRLGALAHALLGLRPDQWDYSTYVAKYDVQPTCGTICCAAGWLPRVDPKHWRWVSTDFTGCCLEDAQGRGFPGEQGGALAYFPGVAHSDIMEVFIHLHRTYSCPPDAITPSHVAAELARLAIDKPPYTAPMGYETCADMVRSVWPKAPSLA